MEQSLHGQALQAAQGVGIDLGRGGSAKVAYTLPFCDNPTLWLSGCLD